MKLNRGIILLGTVVALLVAFILVRPGPQGRVQNRPGRTDIAEAGSRTAVRPLRDSTANVAPLVRETARRTPSNDELLSPTTKRQSQPITGWILDDFRTWGAVPRGYEAENILMDAGGITIGPDGKGEYARTAVLQSSALSLNRPAQPMPASPRKEMPPGTRVDMEVAFSQDGGEWTMWNPIERYGDPMEGLNGGEASRSAKRASASSGVVHENRGFGPFVRYRLTLTSNMTTAPVLHDVRIWHAEDLQETADSTSLDSAPLQALRDDTEEMPSPERPVPADTPKIDDSME